MPMIDVYATSGTVADSKALARDLAATLMKIERVPDIRIFRRNTASFVHDLACGARSSVERNSAYLRVQVLRMRAPVTRSMPPRRRVECPIPAASLTGSLSPRH